MIHHRAFYEDHHGRWRVRRLIRFAAQHAKAERLVVTRLLHNFRKTEADEPFGSEAFIERAYRADLRYPIIVCREPGGWLTVLDGLHRLWKAHDRGSPEIWGRVLTRRQLRTLPCG